MWLASRRRRPIETRIEARASFVAQEVESGNRLLSQPIGDLFRAHRHRAAVTIRPFSQSGPRFVLGFYILRGALCCAPNSVKPLKTHDLDIQLRGNARVRQSRKYSK